MNIHKKMSKRWIYAVGPPIFLALLFNACTLFLKPGEGEGEEDAPKVDENMFDCFCVVPNQDQNNFICIESPGTDNSGSLAGGHGKGLLDELNPTDTWNLIGNNPEDTEEDGDPVRRLILTITGDEPSYPEITAVYDAGSRTLTLSETNGTWEMRAIGLCEH